MTSTAPSRNSVLEQAKKDMNSVKKISEDSDNPPKQNSSVRLTTGEIVAIAFSALFVAGAVVMLVLALKKKNGGKKND